MLTKKEERTHEIRTNPVGGSGELDVDSLFCEPQKPQKVRTYAHMQLAAGGEIGYHTHSGESESYYILSGTGTYNDDGTSYSVRAGDVTFTPSGHGHGLKNDGDVPLSFMALIVLD